MPENTLPYALPSSDVLTALASDSSTGLKQAEARRRLAENGPNSLMAAAPRHWWMGLASQFNQLVIWILIAAALISGFLSDWTDAVAIMAIVILNALLGYFQEERAARALDALRNLSSPQARIIRDSQQTMVPASEIVTGDVVQLEAGDKVCADARLISSHSLTVQEATLTGESAPVEKRADSVLAAETPLAERENLVYQGTTIAAGKATAVVTATGMQTELGRIAGMLQQGAAEPTPLQRRLAELGRVLIGACLGIVAVISVLQIVRGAPLVDVFVFSVSLAVAAVPEGLPAVVTISLALGLTRMARRHALVRKLPSVETLGSVTVICTDKTGTLTRNEMTVREVATGSGRYSVSGAGFDPQGEFQAIDGPQPPHGAATGESSDAAAGDLKMTLSIGTLCNSARVARGPEGTGPWQVVGDPTEGALIVAAMKYGIQVDPAARHLLHEIPFDSERKTMSVVLRTPEGVVLYSKGAPEVILGKCTHERVAGKTVPLAPERQKEVLQVAGDMAGRALRVLALAYREGIPADVDDPAKYDAHESELVLAGLVGMIDPPRDEARAAVAKCQAAGIRVVMITGDHPATALAIARDLKIAGPDADTALTGRELDGLSDADLSQRVAQVAVYARVTAEHKLRVVQAWKSNRAIVAMTGDGVNDAPAVQAADIGIAMGLAGTDVTKEASDMVLTDDNFASIVSAVEEGRGIFDNIQKVVHYLLATNSGEVLLMLLATLIGWPFPLRPIQILWINLITDGLPALALTREPPDRAGMSRPPRPAREPVIDWRRGLAILFHGTMIAATGAVAFQLAYRDDPNNLDLARTTTFCVVAFSQLAFALACRSGRETWPQLGFFTNRMLFVALVLSAALQLCVIYVPPLRPWFGIAGQDQINWVLVVILSLIPTTLAEGSKLFRPRGEKVG